MGLLLRLETQQRYGEFARNLRMHLFYYMCLIRTAIAITHLWTRHQAFPRKSSFGQQIAGTVLGVNRSVTIITIIIERTGTLPKLTMSYI